MGYYAGDFYAGARGDPGFLSNLFTLGKSALGFLPGGGAITKVADVAGRAATAGRSMLKVGAGALAKHPAITAAGAAGAVGLATGVVGTKLLGGHRKCRHINTRTGKCRRHMNSCNPRALRRAIRRTHAFARLAMKTIHIVHPKKKGHFGGFKVKRKAR